MRVIIAGILCLALSGECFAAGSPVAKITFYCSCSKCCNKMPSDKAYGIMASGKKVYKGAIACNWIKFGTKVNIKGLGTFTVEDRGARSLFGTFKKPIAHFDVWMPDHRQALKAGVLWREYKICVT